jgi:glycosyltransferase involved in cell wall biosynthesis
MFPDAPIYTSYCSDEWRERLDNKVITGFLQKWPFSKLRKFVPILRIWWFTHLDLSGYDLIVSTSGAEAKGVKTGPKTTHINYCHSPTHYYWVRYDEYLKHPGFGKWLDPVARIGLRLFVGPLRMWDYKASTRPDVILANSTHTQEMIKKYYRRDSIVVFPPVDIDRFKVSKEELRHGFVTAGRQTPYKRIDLAVAACTELNLPLVVIGNGPEHRKLEKMAGRSVTFLTNTNDESLANHFRTALAFIFPGMDDFGITPIEAMAASTPVIAYSKGGALDYVIENKTGTFFDKQTTKSLVRALEDFNPGRYKSADLLAKASEFSPAVFRTNIQEVIDKYTAK